MEMQASRDYDFADPPDELPPSPGTTARERMVYGGAGAATGAGLSLWRSREPYRQMREQKLERQAFLTERAKLQAAAAAKAQQAAEAAAATPQSSVIRNVPESSGAANWTRKMGDIPYNVAEQARTMDKRSQLGGQSLINKDTARMQQIEQMGHGAWKLSSPGPDQIMLSPQALEERAALAAKLQAEQAAAAQQAAKAQALASAPKPLSGLDEVSQLFQRFAKTPLIKYGGPLAGGASIGVDVADVLGEARKKEPDVANLGLSGLGALGTALSLFPPTAPVGIPLSIGAPAAKYLYETHGQRQAPLEAFKAASPY